MAPPREITFLFRFLKKIKAFLAKPNLEELNGIVSTDFLRNILRELPQDRTLCKKLNLLKKNVSILEEMLVKLKAEIPSQLIEFKSQIEAAILINSTSQETSLNGSELEIPDDSLPETCTVKTSGIFSPRSPLPAALLLFDEVKRADQAILDDPSIDQNIMKKQLDDILRANFVEGALHEIPKDAFEQRRLNLLKYSIVELHDLYESYIGEVPTNFSNLLFRIDAHIQDATKPAIFPEKLFPLQCTGNLQSDLAELRNIFANIDNFITSLARHNSKEREALETMAGSIVFSLTISIYSRQKQETFPYKCYREFTVHEKPLNLKDATCKLVKHVGITTPKPFESIFPHFRKGLFALHRGNLEEALQSSRKALDCLEKPARFFALVTDQLAILQRNTPSEMEIYQKNLHLLELEKTKVQEELKNPDSVEHISPNLNAFIAALHIPLHFTFGLKALEEENLADAYTAATHLAQTADTHNATLIPGIKITDGVRSELHPIEPEIREYYQNFSAFFKLIKTQIEILQRNDPEEIETYEENKTELDRLKDALVPMLMDSSNIVAFLYGLEGCRDSLTIQSRETKRLRS